MISNNVFLNALAHRASLEKLILFLKSSDWSYERLKDYQERLLISRFGIDINYLTNIELRDKSYFKLYPTWKTIADQKIISEKIKWKWGRTSGSTGEPFKFVRPISENRTSGSLAMRWYIEHNVLGKRFLRMGQGVKWSKMRKISDYIVNIRRGGYFDIDKDLMRMIRKFKPEVMRCNASAIYDIAKRLGRGFISPLVFITSENMEPYMEYIKERFGNRVFMNYGGSEFGMEVAQECPEHTLHINMEGYIVEEIDSELIVTNLLNNLQPFLRYKTGDMGKIKKKYKCKCGRTTDIITKIVGRMAEYYNNPHGRDVSWWITRKLYPAMDYIKQWQIIVKDERTILLRVIPVSLSKTKEKLYFFRVSVESETNMNVVIEYVDNIEQTRLKPELIKIEV